MLYLLVSNIAISLCFAIHICLSCSERKKMSEMIASKNYAEYKKLETGSSNNKEYKTMFARREEKMARNNKSISGEE